MLFAQMLREKVEQEEEEEKSLITLLREIGRLNFWRHDYRISTMYACMLEREKDSCEIVINHSGGGISHCASKHKTINTIFSAGT
jgi:butyrate kinase